MRWRAMQRFDSGVRRAKAALSISPFDKPKKGRIAVKVINHLGDEVMKVFAYEWHPVPRPRRQDWSFRGPRGPANRNGSGVN